MKFVIDVNLSPRWADLLASAGHEAVHWSEVGPRNAPDGRIAEWAVANGHAVLTADLDFGALLARRGVSGPSVVLMRSENTRHPVMGSRVLAAIFAAHAELSAGALVTVDEYRARLTSLPFEVRNDG